MNLVLCGLSLTKCSPFDAFFFMSGTNATVADWPGSTNFRILNIQVGTQQRPSLENNYTLFCHELKYSAISNSASVFYTKNHGIFISSGDQRVKLIQGRGWQQDFIAGFDILSECKRSRVHSKSALLEFYLLSEETNHLRSMLGLLASKKLSEHFFKIIFIFS